MRPQGKLTNLILYSFEINIERNQLERYSFKEHRGSENLNSSYELNNKNNFLYGSVSEKVLDEARYNLATHVMSNGVELIITNEKEKYIENFAMTTQKVTGTDYYSHPILITIRSNKPLTLAPSTLKKQMILTLPPIRQDPPSIPKNVFVRKICLTTYTYNTTNVKNGSFHLVSKKVVITKSFTEDRNYLHASNSMIPDVTFSKTPDLLVAMYPTTYHYFNTIDRGQSTPIIFTSTATVTSTIRSPEYSLALPHSMKDVSPSTKTYFSYILFTRTVYDELGKPIHATSKKNLTEVVLTEPFLVSTYVNTEVTDIVSSEEHFNNSSSSAMNYEDYLIIYSTKAMLETQTFCTSMYNTSLTISKEACEGDLRVPHHQLTRQTQVIKHIITDTVVSSLLNSSVLLSLKSKLLLKKNKHQRESIVTMITFLPGEIIRVTGVYIIQTPNLNNFTASKKQTAISLLSATSISREPNPTLITKKADFDENFSTVLNNASLYTSPFTYNKTDLILLASENSDIYIRTKNKLIHSRLSSSTSKTSTIKREYLESFRPVLNVLAHLLKKQFVNLQIDHPYTQASNEGCPKSNRVPSQTISTVIEKQAYIPLAQNISEKLRENRLKSDHLGKLNINILHIYPPRMDALRNTRKKISPQHEYAGYMKTSRIYETELMNTGIPIRPGEVVTASANVIFGRPNINVGVFHTLFNEHKITVNNRHKISLKSFHLNNPIYSNMLDNSQNKRASIDYASILKPPIPINHQKQLKSATKYSQLSHRPGEGGFSSIKLLQKNPSLKYYFSFDPIVHIDAAFYSHHILDIFRTPQKIVTSLSVSKSYVAMSNSPEYSFSQDRPVETSLSNVTPVILSKLSTVQQINLKGNVISHTINMHAGPLTFKTESESIPYATSVKGYTDTLFISHVKIPISDEKIYVHITPNRKSLFSLEYDKLDHDKYYNKVKFTGDSFGNIRAPNKINAVYQNDFSSQPIVRLDSTHNGELTKHINEAPNKTVKAFTEPYQTAAFNTTKNKNLFSSAASNRMWSVITYKTYANSHLNYFTEHASVSGINTIVPRPSNFSAYCSSISREYYNFTSSLAIWEVPQLRSRVSIKSISRGLTPITDIKVQASKMELSNSLLYNLGSLNTIQELHFKPGKDLLSVTLCIIRSVKNCKNSSIHKLKNDVKMLEPSEIMQDDTNSLSQKSMETDFVSLAEKTTNNLNTLQITKTDIIDAQKYIPLKNIIVNTSKINVMKPGFISVQKVLISQDSPYVSILNSSDYVVNSYNVKDYLMPSGSADNFEMENMQTIFSHTDFRNKSSSSLISNSNPDQIMNAFSDLRNMPFRADLIDSMSQRIDLIKRKSNTACDPTCRLNKNEICVTYGNSTESIGICECRPSFGHFDECRYEHFYDCSPNAQCFNLIGSYTCSCKEGYIDKSDNSLYPGRHCLNNIIGCDKCNYNGKCVNDSAEKSHKDIVICKCNAWYIGTKCQVNLKVIILFILTSGAILSSLVLFLFLLIITQRKKQVDWKTSQLIISASSLSPSLRTSTKSGRSSVHEMENVGELCKVMTLISKKEYNEVNNHFITPETHKKTIVVQNYTNAIASTKVEELNIKGAFTQNDFLYGSTDRGSQHEDQINRSPTLRIPRAKFRFPDISQNSCLCHNGKRSSLNNTEKILVQTDDDYMTANRFSGPSCEKHLKYLTLSDNLFYRGNTLAKADLVPAVYEVSSLITDKIESPT
ncbi:GM23231 [Drosophila sechellia]|uniref:GM23231 n=1 Tax=Drosophila sechellia TaxID=7238 RepID=B4IL84_DROSE|nr:GM23231 [Drosophila sechellia]